MLLLTLYFAIQSYAVQTWLAKEMADRLSDKLKTHVSIRTARIDFFNKVVLEDVYIEDRQQDTVVYISRLQSSLEEIETKKQNLLLGDVILQDAKVYLVKQSNDSIWNYKYILRALSGNDTITSSDPVYWNIGIGKVILNNARFAYRNEHDTSKSRAMNYADMLVTGINTQFSDIVVEADTIRASVDYLRAKEKCGFVLDNLSCYVNLCPVQTKLDVLKIKTANSTVETDLVFRHTEYDDYNSFEEKMKMKATFTKSKVYSGDIAYFAPELKGMDKMMELSGTVSGLVTDLRGRDMEISLGNATVFKGNFDMNGLPDIENTYMHFTIKKMTTTRQDLVQLPSYPFYKKEKLEIPNNIALLGLMSLKGDFSGFINDFVMYGTLSTSLGKVSTDVSFRQDSLSGMTFYKGRVRSENFNIGKYLYVDQLGSVSANAMVEGRGLNKNNLIAKLKGDIHSLEFNGYNYQNINVEGDIARRVFKGKLEIRDDNLNLDFNGNVDFSKEITNLDFISSINSADIAALKFIKSENKTDLSSLISIRIEGNNVDNLTGRINFDNTVYKDGDNTYRFSTFDLVSEEEGSNKTISLYSDFAHAYLKGKYSLTDIVQSFEELLNHYFPSYFVVKEKKKKAAEQDITYLLEFKKSNDFTKLFFPGMKIAPGTRISGMYNSSSPGFSLAMESASLVISGTEYKQCRFEMEGSKNKLEATSSVKRILFINDTLGLSNITLNTKGGNDSLRVNIDWDNKTEKITKGSLALDIRFGQHRVIDASFLPTQFVLNDSVWSLTAGNSIHLDSTDIMIRNFSLRSGHQQVLVQGKVSENRNEQLMIDVIKLNLATLNPFLSKQGITLQGIMDSKTSVSDVYKNIIFASGSEILNLVVNNELVGNGSLESVYDNKKHALYLHGSFTKGIVPNIMISGYYYPASENENLDLELNLQALKLQLLEPYVKEYCADLKGQFSGSLSIKGTPEKPRFSGKLNVQAKKVTVNYLNTSYSFIKDEITITENSFVVNNLLLTDQFGNTALVSGKVTHRNFKNFQLSFSLETNKFLLLNTTEAHNDLYYGRAFVSGTAEVFGFLDNITIDANLKTEKISEDKKVEYTKIFIPLSSAEEVDETGFITFVKKDTGTAGTNAYKVNLDGIQLNMDLEVTPDAQVQLIFDEKIGDIIKGRGTGNIKMRINTLGNFYMYGDYHIEDGDYLFTLKNVINKKFRIEKGGVIKWSGDPYGADINLTTIYQTRASLKPFFPFDSAAIYKKRYPANCVLKLTGELMSPTIAFDITLPTVDESTKQTVKGYMNSEQELNQQVFSLLVMNSFVTPAQLRSMGVGETSRGNAVTANSSELLSNQLSNWLSQISNDFDIGVNYRQGDEISDEQLEVALSTQLFNDRVSIDGNVGVTGSNEQDANNLVGDVSVDYKLSDDGKFRVKAFNKSNDNIVSTGKGPYTQGMGLFYREEFETVGQLYRRYLEKMKKSKNKAPEKEKKDETNNPG